MKVMDTTANSKLMRQRTADLLLQQLRAAAAAKLAELQRPDQKWFDEQRLLTKKAGQLRNKGGYYGPAPTYEPTSLPCPTKARPGSVEKIMVLQARVEQGQILHHADDVSCLHGRISLEDDDVQRLSRRLLDEMSRKVDDDE